MWREWSFKKRVKEADFQKSVAGVEFNKWLQVWGSWAYIIQGLRGRAWFPSLQGFTWLDTWTTMKMFISDCFYTAKHIKLSLRETINEKKKKINFRLYP